MKDITASYFKDPTVLVFAIIEKDGSILIVQRLNRQKRSIWSLPGGAVKPGETRTQALVARCHEQCGVEIAPQDEIAKQEISPTSSTYIFSTTYIEGHLKPSKNVLNVTWFPFDSDLKKLQLPKVQLQAIQVYLQ